jgi:hypothetical protein
VKKLILVVLTILIALPAYADTASELIGCGVNDVQAGCMANVMDESYGTVVAAGADYSTSTAITKKITYVTASDDAKGVSLPTPDRKSVV